MVLLVECILLCALFTLIILPPQFKDPLSQIASYPPAIRKRVESLPQYKDILAAKKKRNVLRKIIGTAIAVLALAALAYFSGKTSFFPAFVHVFILFLAVNLYDLVVLDFMVFPNSNKVIIPGTEDMAGEYKNPAHHIKGACKGVAIGTIVALLSAAVVQFTQAVL